MARKTNPEGLTLDQVREFLEYDPISGVFKWRKRTSNRVLVGGIAGVIAGNGYVYITLHDYKLLAHRVAWFYVTGKWPEEQLDHVNRERADNRLVNLRPASQSQNSCNGSLRSTNKSGYRGVSWEKRKRKWQARIVKDGKQYPLGYFDTKESAYDAYLEAAKRLHGEFAG